MCHLGRSKPPSGGLFFKDPVSSTNVRFGSKTDIPSGFRRSISSSKRPLEHKKHSALRCRGIRHAITELIQACAWMFFLFFLWWLLQLFRDGRRIGRCGHLA